MRPHDLGWLAGILEGEGTFVAGPPSSPRCPIVRVEMTDRDVVLRVGALIERAVCSPTPRGGNQRTYATAIKGRPAIALMLRVAPLLSEVRRAQIRRALRLTGPRRLPRAARSPDLHWLAGLLEGEGSFFAKRHGASPGLEMRMCDRATVRRAADQLGIPRVIRDDTDLKRGWRASYWIKVSGNAALPWLRTLRPLMGERRGRAIDRALASWTPTRLWRPPAGCVVAGCVRPHRSRGLCHPHYMRWSRYRAVGKDPGFRPLR
ncbi:MAG TPA: hypothetical protein VGA38_01010 [Candidatus Limnocylindria bacterium]